MQRNVSGSYRVAIMANSEKPEKLSLVWLNFCVNFWANRKFKHLKDIIFWRQKVAFFLAIWASRASREREHLEIYWVLFWLVQTHKWLLGTWMNWQLSQNKKKHQSTFTSCFNLFCCVCPRSKFIPPSPRPVAFANTLLPISFFNDLQFCSASNDHFGLVLTSCLSQFRLERSDPTRHLHTQIKGSYLNCFAKKCEANHFAIS